MPNTKISALTAGDPALSTDAIPIARSGANFQLTAASVANLYSRTTVTAASAAPVTLTVASALNNIVTGSGGQVIQLPDATTLTVGTAFQFNNNQSSGAITVNNNSGTLIVSVPSGGLVVVTLLTNGAAAGTWDRHDLAPTNVSWSTNTFDYPGSITSATWNGVTVATNRGGTGLASFTSGGAVYATSTSALTTGTLPTASGGTNLTSFTSGGAVYATSTSALTTGTLPLASGGTGQTTKAAAFNALSPVTTTGDLIIGNGTNSSTRLAIGSNSYVLTSNGSTASWQPAAGGGGGVTSFDAGSTGFSPSGATTGAITLSGTLNTGNGGTGTSSTPSNGQLLIGNGGGYSLANLTAGSGISITNSSGGITIAASGGGPAYIDAMTVYTSGFSPFISSSGAGASAPLIGYSNFGTAYGAAFMKITAGAYSTSSVGPVNQIDITDSASAFTSYLSGTDFSSTVSPFYVYDDILSFYNLNISNATLQTLFSNSATTLTSPSLAPLDPSFPSGGTNPIVRVYDATSDWDNTLSSGLGIVVTKSGSVYDLFFATSDTTSVSGLSIILLELTINGSTATYTPGVDLSISSASNNSFGKFTLTFTVSNPTLQALLDNSIR